MNTNKLLEIVYNRKNTSIYQGDLFYYFRSLLVAPNNNNGYHNFMHSCHVLEQAYEACCFARLNRRDARNLLVAAMFHDFGHSGKMGNDEKEIETALFFLEEIIIPEDKKELEALTQLILATKYPHDESENLGEIALMLRDADLSQILADNWVELCVFGLAKEMGLKTQDILRENIRFLKSLKFQSRWGQLVLQNKVVPRLHDVIKLYHSVS